MKLLLIFNLLVYIHIEEILIIQSSDRAFFKMTVTGRFQNIWLEMKTRYREVHVRPVLKVEKQIEYKTFLCLFLAKHF